MPQGGDAQAIAGNVPRGTLPVPLSPPTLGAGLHLLSPSSLAASSVPDYDHDYPVMARVPPEETFERHAPRLLNFLHSYAANPGDARRKLKEEAVKLRWLDAGIYQSPDGNLYKQLLEEPSSTDSDYEPTETDLKQWLKLHKKRKRICEQLQKRSQDQEGALRNSKYKYKSWGVLTRNEPISLEADFDDKEELRLNFRPEEVEAMIAAEKARLLKKRFAGAHVSRGRGNSAHQWGLQSSSSSSDDSSSGEDNSDNSDSESDQQPPPPITEQQTPPVEVVKRGRKKKEKTPAQLAAEAAAKRRKLWSDLSKKDAHRAFKHNQASRKESLHLAKKLAVGCMREVRKRALASQKIARENASRSKRLCREMQALWKRYDRAEKDQRKRAEKEALEQLKVDAELREAKRQQRKLNFLITQTELYAHFMSRKRTGDEQDASTQDILGKLDHVRDPNDVDFDEDRLKSEALHNARNAFLAHRQETENFDAEFGVRAPKEENTHNDIEKGGDEQMELPQPSMFQGTLKGYQIKGMSWLYGLYDRGINGILADEMGLGKTVQTIAFLCALVERQAIWGPFLVIAPASTLHNWQQELSKFVPRLKVVPYWGNTADRKVLRKFWSARNQDLHTEQSQFHVVVTSYQLVIQDVKFFQRIHWQYMVLDEAQAIKSTASQRWKVLLSFSCRNRLLLTGTPIQNAMQELWGLLHFIMPSLFDSHQEFNEWFSKDIESHAENKTAIDEKHLSRLHMILKPFMLRRIKKDVENELSDKIEIRIDCPLSQRQKDMCAALKKKIRIEDLMQSSGLGVGMAGSAQAVSSATSCLMNIVMQFRKVCNHPDLFEREDVRSPFFMQLNPVSLPKSYFDEELFLKPIVSRRFVNIWIPAKIYERSQPVSYVENISPVNFNTFNNSFEYLSLTGLGATEVTQCSLGSVLDRLLIAKMENVRRERRYHQAVMEEPIEWFALPVILPPRPAVKYSALRNLLFSVEDESNCFESIITITPMAESPAHYEHRVRKLNEHLDDDGDGVKIKVEHIVHKKRPAQQTETIIPPPDFTIGCLMSPCVAAPPEVITSSPKGFRWLQRAAVCGSREAFNWWHHGKTAVGPELGSSSSFMTAAEDRTQFGVRGLRPAQGWSQILIPNKERLVTQSGKLHALDGLLRQLKEGGHRVLIYSQMTRMIDLLEELMLHRRYIYIRLDGSSRISDRRDMVADFQERADIFVFLLSTRAGGLGINLTAADTVIFYDSDWNPTVDQQAMDRAHRLGQTKQVMVYRLICQGSIEERILERAREKSEIQRMVMSGTHMRPHDALKPKEVVSLLLDDDELERKFRQKQEERRLLAQQAQIAQQQAQQQAAAAAQTVLAETSTPQNNAQSSDGGANAAEALMGFLPKRKRSNRSTGRPVGRPKKIKPMIPEDSVGDSVPASPASELSLCSTSMVAIPDDERDEADDVEGVLVVDEELQRVPPGGVGAGGDGGGESLGGLVTASHSSSTKKPPSSRQPLKPKRKRDREREEKRKAREAAKATAAAAAVVATAVSPPLPRQAPLPPLPPKVQRPSSVLGVGPAVVNTVGGSGGGNSGAMNIGSGPAAGGGVVLDVGMGGIAMADTAFAWNDLNLDNLEEIDVNDIDLSSLDNVKV